MGNQMTANIYNLSFQKILAFFAVVECENFTKAAAKLSMSQAAVSRIISNLEWQMNLILFVREVRRTIPTPAGRILYKEWKEAFRSFESGYLAAYKAQLGYIRDLNIGSIDMGQTLSHHLSLIEWYEQAYPDNILKIDYNKTEVLCDGLISRKYDIIFVNYYEIEHLKTLKANNKLLIEKPCSIFVHSSHPLYEKETISCDDLRGQDIVFFGTRDLYASKQLQKFCERYKLTRDHLYFETDYKKVVVLFTRKTGLFFSEGIFEEGQMENARPMLLDDITSGLAMAWLDENTNLPINQIAQHIQKIYKRKYANSMPTSNVLVSSSKKTET